MSGAFNKEKVLVGALSGHCVNLAKVCCQLSYILMRPALMMAAVDNNPPPLLHCSTLRLCSLSRIQTRAQTRLQTWSGYSIWQMCDTDTFIILMSALALSFNLWFMKLKMINIRVSARYTYLQVRSLLWCLVMENTHLYASCDVAIVI